MGHNPSLQHLRRELAEQLQRSGGRRDDSGHNRERKVMANEQGSFSSLHRLKNGLLMPLAELQISAVAIQSENHTSKVDGICEARFPRYAKANYMLPGKIVTTTARTQDRNAVDHVRKICKDERNVP
jgi:hypothetical protein